MTHKPSKWQSKPVKLGISFIIPTGSTTTASGQQVVKYSDVKNIKRNAERFSDDTLQGLPHYPVHRCTVTAAGDHPVRLTWTVSVLTCKWSVGTATSPHIVTFSHSLLQ